MAAATVQDRHADAGTRADTTLGGLRYWVFWNGRLIATSEILADANAVAAAHPA